MKSSNVTIGNRTRDLPACIAVPQSTAPPRAPPIHFTLLEIPNVFGFRILVAPTNSNPLPPTQMYVLCVPYDSLSKQLLFPSTTFTDWSFLWKNIVLYLVRTIFIQNVH